MEFLFANHFILKDGNTKSLTIPIRFAGCLLESYITKAFWNVKVRHRRYYVIPA
jgi:hypothetical protein